VHAVAKNHLLPCHRKAVIAVLWLRTSSSETGSAVNVIQTKLVRETRKHTFPPNVFSANQGRNERRKGVTMLRAPKSSNNVANTFFSTGNLPPKDLRIEHEGARLISSPGRRLTSPRPCSAWLIKGHHWRQQSNHAKHSRNFQYFTKRWFQLHLGAPSPHSQQPYLLEVQISCCSL